MARLGYLVLAAGVDPCRILVITYTVAATIEMKNRTAALFGAEYASRMSFRTISSLSNAIIQRYASSISHNSPLELKDDGEIGKLISSIYLSVTKEYANDNILKNIRTGITNAKNMILKTEEIQKMRIKTEQFPEIYEAYIQEMQKRRWMDYDDQIRFAFLFLTRKPLSYIGTMIVRFR